MRQYYREVHGFLLVYDITNEKSWRSACYIIYAYIRTSLRGPSTLDIRTWYAEILQHASSDVHMVVVGNKLDLIKDSDRAVAEEQGRALAMELGLEVFLVSAKANECVDKAFRSVAR
jgi:Ras-related protein Rab-8A